MLMSLHQSGCATCALRYAWEWIYRSNNREAMSRHVSEVDLLERFALLRSGSLRYLTAWAFHARRCCCW
jgi:hypothetical protein